MMKLNGKLILLLVKWKTPNWKNFSIHMYELLRDKLERWELKTLKVYLLIQILLQEKFAILSGSSNLYETLVVNLEVPESTLYNVFLPSNKCKLGGTFLKVKFEFLKDEQLGFHLLLQEVMGNVTDRFFYFTSEEKNHENGQNSRPWRWQLKLSLRHLLLFYLIKTKPGGSSLTKLEQRNYTYSVLPKGVRDFFQNWNYSHG